jgi:hypothetical protein
MSKVRVWYWSSGKVSVSYPDKRPEKKPEGLTTDEWALKQFENIPKKAPRFQGIPFDDVNSSTLPVRDKNRDRWRGSKGQDIRIDDTVILRQDLFKQLDDELAKPNPDAVKAMKLQRKLDKREHD